MLLCVLRADFSGLKVVPRSCGIARRKSETGKRVRDGGIGHTDNFAPMTPDPGLQVGSCRLELSATRGAAKTNVSLAMPS